MTKVQIGQMIESFDNSKIFCREWNEATEPKGVMFIVHGMVEHSARYQEFAKFMNVNGYYVFSMDLRAHGQTVGSSDQVGIYDGDLSEDIVKDMIFFSDMLIEKYKLPLIVLGHSYGSFLLQRFIQLYHKHSIAIFTGSACMKGSFEVTMGNLVAKITKAFCGKNAKAKLIYKLSFGKYGKNFEHKNWLTRDEDKFYAYVADEFCGNVCSANFYVSFFKNLKTIYKTENLKKIDLDKPMLITSGEKDPVGGKNANLVDKLAKMYHDLGVEIVDEKIWEGMRHEILNEVNRLEVYKYIQEFCDEFCSKKKVKKIVKHKK